MDNLVKKPPKGYAPPNSVSWDEFLYSFWCRMHHCTLHFEPIFKFVSFCCVVLNSVKRRMNGLFVVIIKVHIFCPSKKALNSSNFMFLLKWKNIFNFCWTSCSKISTGYTAKDIAALVLYTYYLSNDTKIANFGKN